MPLAEMWVRINLCFHTYISPVSVPDWVFIVAEYAEAELHKMAVEDSEYIPSSSLMLFDQSMCSASLY